MFVDQQRFDSQKRAKERKVIERGEAKPKNWTSSGQGQYLNRTKSNQVHGIAGTTHDIWDASVASGLI